MLENLITSVLMEHQIPPHEITPEIMQVIVSRFEKKHPDIRKWILDTYNELNGKTGTETQSGSTGLAATPPSNDVVVENPIRMKTFHLPNGKENEPYQCQLNWGELGLGPIAAFQLSLPEQSGLIYHEETKVLSGVPVVPGTMEIHLKYQLEGVPADRPWLEATLSLFVNFDPKRLWVEVEPPTDALFSKDHTKHTRIHAPGIGTLLAASKRGRSHAKDGKFREDDFDAHMLEQGPWWLISVADGKGSSKYSRRGSEVLCETVIKDLSAATELLQKVREMVQDLDPGLAPELASGIKREMLYPLLVKASYTGLQAVKAEADAHALPLEEFLATHLLAIATPVQHGWFIAGFWRGDGGMGIYTAGSPPILLGKADAGEYSGQTAFLDASFFADPNETLARLHCHLVPRFDALVLMTDGITDAWFQTEMRLTEEALWKEMLDNIGRQDGLTHANEKAGEQLLAWLDFWAKGEYDDRTIAILLP